MNERPVARTIDILQWIYALVLAVCFLLVIAAGVLTRDSSGDAPLPLWLGLLIVLAVAVPAGFTVRYYRRRPLLREGGRDYTVTLLFQIGMAASPAIVGFVFALLTESVWVQALGVLLALPGLISAVPSRSDYQRHRDLAEELGPMPPDEKWGEAGPEEVAPWDDEHGEHGHHH